MDGKTNQEERKIDASGTADKTESQQSSCKNVKLSKSARKRLRKKKKSAVDINTLIANLHGFENSTEYKRLTDPLQQAQAILKICNLPQFQEEQFFKTAHEWDTQTPLEFPDEALVHFIKLSGSLKAFSATKLTNIRAWAYSTLSTKTEFCRIILKNDVELLKLIESLKSDEKNVLFISHVIRVLFGVAVKTVGTKKKHWRFLVKHDLFDVLGGCFSLLSDDYFSSDGPTDVYGPTALTNIFCIFKAAAENDNSSYVYQSIMTYTEENYTPIMMASYKTSAVLARCSLDHLEDLVLNFWTNVIDGSKKLRNILKNNETFMQYLETRTGFAKKSAGSLKMYLSFPAFMDDLIFDDSLTFPGEKKGPNTSKDAKIVKSRFEKCGFSECKGKGGGKMKTCSRCDIVRYCSRDCQKNHWKEHKKVCFKRD